MSLMSKDLVHLFVKKHAKTSQTDRPEKAFFVPLFKFLKGTNYIRLDARIDPLTFQDGSCIGYD